MNQPEHFDIRPLPRFGPEEIIARDPCWNHRYIREVFRDRMIEDVDMLEIHASGFLKPEDFVWLALQEGLTPQPVIAQMVRESFERIREDSFKRIDREVILDWEDSWIRCHRIAYGGQSTKNPEASDTDFLGLLEQSAKQGRYRRDRYKSPNTTVYFTASAYRLICQISYDLSGGGPTFLSSEEESRVLEDRIVELLNLWIIGELAEE